MKESIIRCEICSKITALEKNGITEIIEQVHGICWDKIGYSICGWGQRNNFIHSFSGEVCNDCFTALKTKIYEFKQIFEQRQNSCEEGVAIYKTLKDKSTSHKVSELQEYGAN
jgi:hypothetical protein